MCAKVSMHVLCCALHAFLMHVLYNSLYIYHVKCFKNSGKIVILLRMKATERSLHSSHIDRSAILKKKHTRQPCVNSTQKIGRDMSMTTCVRIVLTFLIVVFVIIASLLHSKSHQTTSCVSKFCRSKPPICSVIPRDIEVKRNLIYFTTSYLQYSLYSRFYHC